MKKEDYIKLVESCSPDEYVIPGHHDPEAVKKINSQELFGKARKEAYLEAYIEPKKVKRDNYPKPIEFENIPDSDSDRIAEEEAIIYEEEIEKEIEEEKE